MNMCAVQVSRDSCSHVRCGSVHRTASIKDGITHRDWIVVLVIVLWCMIESQGSAVCRWFKQLAPPTGGLLRFNVRVSSVSLSIE